MIYIDTSSLLKLFIRDVHFEAVNTAIQLESAVVTTSLTQLKASVQLRAIHLGGSWGAARYVRMRGRLAETLAKDPFVIRPLMSRVFTTATMQNELSAIHCCSLDRLHLAAMAELGVTRLMTHDGRQADGAKELGFEVVMPGVD